MIYDPHSFKFARSLRELNRDPYDWFESDPDVVYRRDRRRLKLTVAALVAALALINVVFYYA